MTLRVQNAHHLRFTIIPRASNKNVGKSRQHLPRQAQISPIEEAICSLHPTIPQCAAISSTQGGGQQRGAENTVIQTTPPDGGHDIGFTTPSSTPPSSAALPTTPSTTNSPLTKTQTFTPPLTKSNESGSGTSGPSGGSVSGDTISPDSSSTSARTTSSDHESTESPPERSLTSSPTPSQQIVLVPTTVTESALPTQIISTAVTRSNKNHTALIVGSVLGVLFILSVLIWVILRRRRSSSRWSIRPKRRSDISPFTIPAYVPQDYPADKLQVERQRIRGYILAHPVHQPGGIDILGENGALEDKDSVIGTVDNFGIPTNPPPSYRP